MGDHNSGSSSAQAGKQSNEDPAGVIQPPQRLQSDSTATTTGRDHDDLDAVSKETMDESAIDDYYHTEEKHDDEDEDEEEDDNHHRPTISKRHSSSSRTNVFTECGRHGDDWLFSGIGDVVKSVFGKNDKHDKKQAGS